MKQFFEPAARLGLIPPYLFKAIDDKKAEVKARGVNIIDLGVGDPDLPTPRFIVEKMIEMVQDPKTHRYPAYSGMDLFRKAVARWYRRRFGVELDPESEVLTLIGSKEGIAHLPLGINNPEDINLMTSPGYPVYQMGTLFAGGYCHFVPLTRENRFLPDLNAIPPLVARDAKAFFFNYPNNPTAAVADKKFFARVVDFCQEYRIVAVHDAAYTELAYDGFQPPSFLEVPGAREVGIEFHSLSKTYNMTGWRLGMAVGNREVLAALGKIKSNIDSGAFDAIQHRRDYGPGFGPELRPGKLRHSPGTPGPAGGRPEEFGLRRGAAPGHLLRVAGGASGPDLHGFHHPPAGKGRDRHHPRQRPGAAGRRLCAPGPDGAEGAPARGPGPPAAAGLRV